MIKNIKRVGIIFLAVAIICLMVIGCLSVNSVTNNGSNVSVLSSEKSNSANSNDNSSEYDSVGELEYEIPEAEKEYTLICDCTVGTPCICGQMANTWAEAVSYSITNSVNVKVTLLKDWIAKENSSYTTSFGEGKGFDYGKIIALYKAGWTQKKIGEEIGVSGTAISTALKRYKDKMEDGYIWDAELKKFVREEE